MCTHAPDGLELARTFACDIVCALVCINTVLSQSVHVLLYNLWPLLHVHNGSGSHEFANEINQRLLKKVGIKHSAHRHTQRNGLDESYMQDEPNNHYI